MEVSLADLEPLFNSVGLDSIINGSSAAGSAVWIKFESEVRAAHTAALGRLRAHLGERCADLVRWIEIEEQTRIQAFQGVLMGEVPGEMYQATVRSILEKVLSKLEAWSCEPVLYRTAAQCLSEYMSSLNHHCNTCAGAGPLASQPHGLGAIAEVDTEALEAFDSSSICSAESMQSDSTHSSVPSVLSAAATAPLPAAAPLYSAASSSAGPASVVGVSIPTAEELRKARRREANRNASSKYRSKRTATLSALMEDISALRSQLASKSSENAVLSAENKLLKQQVAFLQEIMNRKPSPAPASGPQVEPSASAGSPFCFLSAGGDPGGAS